MSTGHVLLGLLSRGKQHGYDLKRGYDDRFPTAKPLAFGQVYATLERLHRQGFIEPVAVQRVDGPDRTVYAVTAAGAAELQSWLDRVEEPFAFVSNPLATKVTIAILATSEQQATAYLLRQREAHLRRMRHFTKIKVDPASSLDEVLGADYALSHLDADLRWMDTALQRVTALTKEMHA
ncbi:PadR family transcriptional regulator [Allobranchiibius huperziae]|uniref:DNA-binding PadR family transcriptional regulator n=1 Tax=Allobranchiibius huperziae TaxID=1874116 RepID=A0A853DM86_9MICO|nr:PadR family transcriptional regulator [Allobranchiibius huperziae]NYJ76104.1 DNA-binding PadR family transcriptional regulator [Allobranchiibius huperziae]